MRLARPTAAIAFGRATAQSLVTWQKTVAHAATRWAVRHVAPEMTCTRTHHSEPGTWPERISDLRLYTIATRVANATVATLQRALPSRTTTRRGTSVGLFRSAHAATTTSTRAHPRHPRGSRARCESPPHTLWVASPHLDFSRRGARSLELQLIELRVLGLQVGQKRLGRERRSGDGGEELIGRRVE